MNNQKAKTETSLIRINKFIAANSSFSRRKVDELVSEGRVTINGVTIYEQGFKINPEKDKIKVDGELIKTDTKKIYIILHKPSGIITSVKDEKNRKTVIDLINIKQKVFPVGRLDYDTSGLLILTNDGDFANYLMHPRYKIYKTYIVKLSKPLEEKHRQKLMKGVVIDNKKTSACDISFMYRDDFSNVIIRLYEGRYHQVKKMFKHYGYFVRKLHRSEYGHLNLKGLKIGEWRPLTEKEIKLFYK